MYTLYFSFSPKSILISVVFLPGATPKLVLQMMDVRGLSIAHVKSHLQVFIYTHHQPITMLLLQIQCSNFYTLINQMYRTKKLDDSGQEKFTNSSGSTVFVFSSDRLTCNCIYLIIIIIYICADITRIRQGADHPILDINFYHRNHTVFSNPYHPPFNFENRVLDTRNHHVIPSVRNPYTTLLQSHPSLHQPFDPVKTLNRR